MNQYYQYCVKPKAGARKYWTKRLVWGKWQRKYQHGKYNQDVLKYNQCLRQSKYGRSEINMGVDCNINVNTGKYECGVRTGKAHTNPGTVPNGSQLGLGQDAGSFMNELKQLDQRLLIGAGVALLLIFR